jgi:hypothetical protein
MKLCLDCNKELIGRSDKKFCTLYCKSSYYYQKNKEGENSFYTTVLKQLQQNRKLLKQYNKSGKSIVRKEELLQAGFNPNRFTHYWKNNKGDVYLFCFEFGFLEKKEGNKHKYVLIKWQNYMSLTIR